MTPEEQHRHLVYGLLGDDLMPEYQTSAAFHVAVDHLAALLPVWIHGLATLALHEDAEIERVRRLISAGATTSPIPDTPLSDLLFPERDR